jgi:hypothetical protein
MLRKTLLTLSASAILGAAVFTPNTALAFPLGGPPPLPGIGGPPPLPGVGGSPPHLGPGGPPPHLAPGGPPRLGPGGAPAGRAGVAGRATGYGNGNGHPSAGSYGRSGRYGYGRGHDGVYVYGNGDSSSDGCHYSYSRQRRVLVCD